MCTDIQKLRPVLEETHSSNYQKGNVVFCIKIFLFYRLQFYISEQICKVKDNLDQKKGLIYGKE